MLSVTIGICFVLALASSATARTVRGTNATNLSYFSSETTRCSISLMTELRDPQPLVLYPGSQQFVLPKTSAGNIVLRKSEVIELYCSEGFRPPFTGDTVFASCSNNTQFLVNGTKVSFDQFICNDLSNHTAKLTNRTCIDGQIIEIGFQVKSRWLSLMEVCHDSITATTTWAHFFLNPENNGFQRGYPRIGFIQGDFYDGLNVNNLYTKYGQRKALSNLLGSRELAASLIQEKGDLFLARGHLAARTDYIFGAQQQATFYFLNVAPQWQTFNGGNWATIELHVRKFVDRKNLNVEVYTGTYGVLKLIDINGNPREIYLANNHGRQQVPVPKIYYKVVIERNTGAGIVFIGVNNPYATLDEIKKDYTFCKDVSEKVTYIPWDKHNIKMGYLYACAVPEFAKYVRHLPELPKVNRLLI